MSFNLAEFVGNWELPDSIIPYSQILILFRQAKRDNYYVKSTNGIV